MSVYVYNISKDFSVIEAPLCEEKDERTCPVYSLESVNIPSFAEKKPREQESSRALQN